MRSVPRPRTMAAPLPGCLPTAFSTTVAIFTLALAGSFGLKKIVPVGEGTLQDHRPLFIIWLVFVVVIIGALSFLPALALGPLVEYLMQAAGGVIHV
jgi:K+-transporting ATPase ATPase A chain